MTGLEELRRRILAIDEEILALWKERDEAARQVGALKLAAGQPLQNFEVEKAVLAHAEATAQHLGLSPEPVRGLVRLLITTAVAAQERDRVQQSRRGGRTALVVGGAGRMGTWFSRFLHEQGFDVSLQDPKPGAFPTAPPDRNGFDLVVLSVPPATLATVVEKAAARAKPDGLVLDIASTKGLSAARLQALARAGRRVASLHPMFGPGADLLMGRNVLVLDCGNADAARAAEDLFRATAATTHRLPLDAHDPLMAEVLGLAHATSLLFNATLVASGRPASELDAVASTTFRKQMDLSREVANENPDLYFEIQTENPATPALLERLRRSLDRLLQILDRKDLDGFRRLMREARDYYAEVPAR